VLELDVEVEVAELTALPVAVEIIFLTSNGLRG